MNVDMARLLREKDPLSPVERSSSTRRENPGVERNAYSARAGPTGGRIIKNEELERTTKQ
jgi:hypothetical protein